VICESSVQYHGQGGEEFMSQLPGRSGSCWVTSAKSTSYPSFQGSVHAETVVVGAGIVGLTTALRLCEAGRPVIVIEGLRVGGQVTGRSTAKITTQHSLIYRHLLDTLGLELALTYAEANRAGADQIKHWIDAFGIECALESKSAYAYTSDHGRRADILAEAKAARQLGLTAHVLDRAPLPFDTAGALRFVEEILKGELDEPRPGRYVVHATNEPARLSSLTCSQVSRRAASATRRSGGRHAVRGASREWRPNARCTTTFDSVCRQAGRKRVGLTPSVTFGDQRDRRRHPI
jgi:hypothetical protein